MGSVSVILKKIFVLAVMINALFTVTCLTELLTGFYRALPWWRPFWPYLVNGNLFWLIIIAAILNIYPIASWGRNLHTGRFLFHHYVYGFAVLLLACIFVVAFTSVSLVDLFLINTNDLAVNAGRFFVLGGLVLFLDDLPDVSKRVEFSLSKLKQKAYRGRRIIFFLQLFSGLASFGICFAMVFWGSQHPASVPNNLFLIITCLLTSFTSLVLLRRKDWLKITL
jgi:hypothetical protein